MKTILIFGDSNSWGFIPGTPMHRYPRDARWPGLVADALADRAHLIENTLCGRTTVWPDPIMTDRNGADHLPTLLECHQPLDLVVIMLGTNDLKHYFGFNEHDIATGAGHLVQMVQESTAGPRDSTPAVLLVCPPPAVESPTPFGHKFDGAPEISRRLPAAFAEIAADLNCPWFDAGTVCTPPDTDGIHLDRAGHAALAKAIIPHIESALAKTT